MYAVNTASGALRVAVIDDYQAVAASLAPWSAALPTAEVSFFHDHVAGQASLVARLLPFDVVVAMRERTAFPREVLEHLPQLRLLVTTGMRNASVDLTACARLGITVCGTRSLGSGPAELTWALILGLVRSVAPDDARVRAGGWQQSLGGDLEGQVLGLVGLGRIGSRVARVAQAFGMTVLAWSPRLTRERAGSAGVGLAARGTLFGAADVVSVHLALADATRGVIGRAELRAMKPSAFLVNTSRAALVDQAALRQALTEGWIAGAGLDVFDEEPLPAGHWVRSAPRTLLSPHMGYVTQNNYRGFYADALADIEAFVAGAPVRVLE